MIKYQEQIEKQIPAGKMYKPRMGLKKSNNFFFQIDSEYNKQRRLETIKENVLITEQNVDKIKESLCLFFSPLIFAVDWESETAIADAYFELAKSCDADIMLLNEDTKVISSGVCFPTGWSPEEKIGKTVLEAHENIPDVNKIVGNSITTFLSSLSVGDLYQRSNVGFLAEDILDTRPSRLVRPLASAKDINNVWVRLEHQGITKLKNNCYVFGIKVENIPLKFFICNGENKQGLFSMLTSIPEPMAEYKGINKDVRNSLLSFIR